MVKLGIVKNRITRGRNVSGFYFYIYTLSRKHVNIYKFKMDFGIMIFKNDEPCYYLYYEKELFSYRN